MIWTGQAITFGAAGCKTNALSVRWGRRLVSNRSVTVPPPPYILFRFPYTNGIRGTANGGEIELDWNATLRWRLGGSYARVLIDLENKPGDTDVNGVNRYERSTPRQQGMLRSSLNLPGDVELDHTYRHVGALPSKGINAYHTADMRLAWHVSPALELSVAGRDLFEPRHLEFPHSPGPNVSIRRSIYASATWRRGQSSAP